MRILNRSFLIKGRFSTQENKYGIGPDRTDKIEPFGSNFLFQFESVIRNPDDKELVRSIFNFFWPSGADSTRSKNVLSDPMLIFLSGNRH